MYSYKASPLPQIFGNKCFKATNLTPTILETLTPYIYLTVVYLTEFCQGLKFYNSLDNKIANAYSISIQPVFQDNPYTANTHLSR